MASNTTITLSNKSSQLILGGEGASSGSVEFEPKLLLETIIVTIW